MVDTNFSSLQARIDKLRLKRAHVAALTGLSASCLSAAFHGQMDLSYPDFRKVSDLIRVCELLQDRAGVPIDWRCIAILKNLIHEFQIELMAPSPRQ